MNKGIEFSIREAKIDDAERIVELTKELGYEVSNEEIQTKLNKFSSNLGEKIYVAEYETVIGWMHISLVEPLESKAFVEIRGIVVQEEYRKKGIGTKLIEKAENWAREKGCNKIRVRTNIKREETRKYYSNLNYILMKTQEVFEKEIMSSQQFYHGTKSSLKMGDYIEPGFNSNFGKRKKASYVYLTATLDAAIWGAELALGEEPGRIYIVEPTGSIEDDPNLTDKKFPGNPTKSYRSGNPLRVVGEVTEWEGHSPEKLKAMKEHLEQLKQQGIEAIEN